MATADEIAVSYDVGNDFFRRWLDERMNYSCAVWHAEDTLETAQQRKLRTLHEMARITSDKRVLDVGCGWGANLHHLAVDRGVGAAHGITMSPSQQAEIVARELPGVSVELTDYREFHPARRYDAVVSIEMFEHIATPEQARHGEHIDVFRDYFRRTHAWTNEGAWFALQTILIKRLPRDRRDIEDMVVATRTILPGSKCARMDEVIRSCGPYWELMHLVTRREDYVRTCRAWHDRLLGSEPEIRATWGHSVFADYEHYLRGCANAFEAGYLTLAQIALRRNDSIEGDQT